jgi:shikimate dehydrogenase
MGVPYAEVIGDPVAHSKSPLIHKYWLAKLGLDYDYRHARVTPEQLPAYLDAARNDPLWCGANVTIPLKSRAAELVDELVFPAPSIGAVNTIVRRGRQQPILTGHNTDAAGFLEPLQTWLDPESEYRVATLVGTGGAAAAVAWALRRSGFIVIAHSQELERAKTFLRGLGEDDMDFAQRLDTLAGPAAQRWGADRGHRSGILDILVNASPRGMTNHPPLAVNLAKLPPNLLVYDLVYDPLETLLLKAARERGLRTISGLDMLIAQAALAFEMFFSQPAPREHDAELMERLTS